MFKEFLLKKMLESKLKEMPQAEQEKLMKMVQKDPAFFKKIAEEIQGKLKGGKGDMDAAMEVMRNNEAQLRELLK